MQPELPGAAQEHHVKDLVVNGLHVSSYSAGSIAHWGVRSKHTVITATGSDSSAVVNTLSLATPDARAAPGILDGTEYLGVVGVNPVTGLVSLTRLDTHGPPLPAVQAYDGHFSDTLPPGRYQLTGHAGNARCPSIRTIVRSGETSDVSEILCEGK
jgi:hypothetical protein